MKDLDPCPECGEAHVAGSLDCPAEEPEDREALEEKARQLREVQDSAEPDELSGRGWALWREPRG